MSRHVLIVGNAPIEERVAGLVDGADHVVRFNKTRGFGGASGSRTDELWLINHGGQMAEWLARDTLTALPAVAFARTIVLPVPMLPGHLSAVQARRRERDRCESIDPDRVNHLAEAQRRLEKEGRTVTRVTAGEYGAAQRALAALSGASGPHHPSSGFIAIHRTLARAGSAEYVTLCGFTFEGWRGHSWDAERRWVLEREREGRVTVRRAAARSTRAETISTRRAGSPPIGISRAHGKIGRRLDRAGNDVW